MGVPGLRARDCAPGLRGTAGTATGETALSYLHRVRIETAKEMLGNDSLTIDVIAQRVGYQDTTHFGRLFKRFTGPTPGQFRRGDSAD